MDCIREKVVPVITKMCTESKLWILLTHGSQISDLLIHLRPTHSYTDIADI